MSKISISRGRFEELQRTAAETGDTVDGVVEKALEEFIRENE